MGRTNVPKNVIVSYKAVMTPEQEKRVKELIIN